MKVAAAYVRVSTDDQMEYSPDSQLEQIRKYARGRGMLLREEFVFREGEGVSGRTANRRPAFQRMIAAAKRKPRPFEVILVWKFSRFARNQEESIVYKSLLRRECGIEVVSVSEPVTDGPFGSLIERIIEWMDEYYSTRLAGEVKRGMSEKVARGEPVSIPPFGYEIRAKKYVADPETAPIVRMIFRDYIAGEGCRAIAEKLNGMGVRTGRGGLWENRTVEYILRNPAYIGKIRWNPERKTRRNYDDPDIVIANGGQSPLLDGATWEKAQARMLRNKGTYGRAAGPERPAAAMLQGLVKCSACGSTLSAGAGGTMQCTGYSHGKCSVSHGIQAARLEAMVVAALEEDLLCREIAVSPSGETAARASRGETGKLLARERHRLFRIREAYEGGADSLEEYQAEKQKILRRIDRLQAEAAASAAPETDSGRDGGPRTVDLPCLLKNPDVSPQVKNVLLRSFVNHIVFDRRRNQIRIYYAL